MEKRQIQRRCIVFFFILLLSFIPIPQPAFSEESSPYLLINEIMYYPTQPDAYNEWIELYNPTSHPIDVNGWILADESEEDTLEPNSINGNGTTIIPPYGYALVTDHGTQMYSFFEIPADAVKLFVDDSTLCGYGLNNEQEKIMLKKPDGSVVDAVEYGENYDDVPGLPAKTVNQGNSLIRYPDMQSQNSLLDFTVGIIPTPGAQNSVDLDFTIYPLFVPKLYAHEKQSIPFSLRITLCNLSAHTTYHLKTYIVGDANTTNPATQTWNGATWKYSDNYSTTLTTDSFGCWSDWQHVRFSKDYVQYENNIKNKNTAYLKFKLKQENNTYEITKKISLLDMDTSTTNATPGGCAIGQAQQNQMYLENKILILKDIHNRILGVSTSEDNNRDEGFINTSGYYKISCPVGSEYTLYYLELDQTLKTLLSQLSIQQGVYKIGFEQPEKQYLVRKNENLTIPLFIINNGDLTDTIKTSIRCIAEGWTVSADKTNHILAAGELGLLNLCIQPDVSTQCANITIFVSAQSTQDISCTASTKVQVALLGPDLYVKNSTCYDRFDQKKLVFGEGEIIRIKGQLNNQGTENASNVTIGFYYDAIDQEHLIDQKFYDSVTKYYKYPSIDWDTKNIPLGNHSLFVVADPYNTLCETLEHNNIYETMISLCSTIPEGAYSSLVITELYYHTYPNHHNEFITLYNPTNRSVNLSEYYLTTDTGKKLEDQKKLLFPMGSWLPEKTACTITQNATTYVLDRGRYPDFEYENNSDTSIPDMICTKKITLSNTGSMIALKDFYNHTIDLVAYGTFSQNILEGWSGEPVQKSGEGIILTRKKIQDIPVDTDSSDDWNHPRVYGIGQSDFQTRKIFFKGVVQPFVSPDNSFETITTELRKANQSIFFNIYEFTNPLLGDELIRALRRNVSVTLFVEGSPVGGIDATEKYILQRIANHGGIIRFIVNDPKNNAYKRYQFDHAKYLIIDQKTVIVESCNWAKTGVPENPTYGNREWGVVIHNPDVANYFYSVFMDDYNKTKADSRGFDQMQFVVPEDFFIDKTSRTGNYQPCFPTQPFNGEFNITPVFSPDNSQTEIMNLIESATNTIYIQQLYIYKNWKNSLSPFVEKLVNKSEQGVDIRIIMNYNPGYGSSNDKINETKKYCEDHGIQVKFVYINWSIFSNVHNKGMIIDNMSVLISSINWNENSVQNNREAGVILENPAVASYYAKVFWYDWTLQKPIEKPVSQDYKNQFLIALIIIFTIIFIALDWRKRPWK